MGRVIDEWVTTSSEETIQVGGLIAERAAQGGLLCFFGELGSGKTTLIKGIVHKITGLEEGAISSPTFVLLNIYGEEGKKCVYHFDLYRLHSVQDFLYLGFDQYFAAEGFCCIEWSEKIKSILPENALSIHLSHLGENKRRIWVK